MDSGYLQIKSFLQYQYFEKTRATKDHEKFRNIKINMINTFQKNPENKTYAKKKKVKNKKKKLNSKTLLKLNCL